MTEMQVYIANLGKYNEGELVGGWFSPPVDFEVVSEQIGLNEEYEEYAIHDYELPFTIDEYTPIDEVNRLCELVFELEGTDIYDELSEIQSYWFNDIEDLIEHKDDIMCYSDCDSMEDVARYYVEETGSLGEIPNHLQNYIDYQALGRDIEIEGSYLITSHGVFEYLS
ncbi:antirestriction protein ArdA [Carnobacterium gallinarum]|uniref:antirestriction protein ArdA n=1 Tax=Carnobacterium gallinarum TaxID=2749 RepID=UPI00054DB510|nr:antirestriction protein ArdA [Carnobacterium gallinarum]